MIPRIAIVSALILSLTSTVLAQTDDPGAPPAGIAPSSMTLAQLLRLHGKAAKRSAVTAWTEVWKYLDGEIAGTQTDRYAGDNYREDTQLGPFHSAGGSYRGVRWEQNENGLVRNLSDLHDADVIDDRALAHALLPGSGVTLLGKTAHPDAYVVRVDPPRGRLEYLFFDASTYRLVRSDRVVTGQRVVTTYDDFRGSSTGFRPWHVHQTNGLEHGERDWTLQSVTPGAPADAPSWVPPSSSDVVALTASRVALPADIGGDRVILTASMGGRKVNFQLDSGASGILFDRGIADALHAQSLGRRTEITAGRYVASDAILPGIDFGTAVMKNVAVETAPFHTWTYDERPVAGLLGYDFLASCVVHVDYQHGTAEAFAPGSFAPPAGALALPIALDDGVPVVAIRLGSVQGKHFIIDTGADRSMIFSAFAAAHPRDVQGAGGSEALEDSLPLVDSISGVGGKVQVYEAQVSGLDIGGLTFPKWRFEVSQDAPGFEGEDYDGLIGQDVLRYFDVYFDYSRLRVYLVPNDRYRQRWG